MKKSFRFLILFLSCAVLCLSFGPSDDKGVEEAATRYFLSVVRSRPEKLYLHLDKPYYGAGERIWFSGYLLDAVTHTDECLSNFIYVELCDRQDSVVLRHKFKRDSLGFHGSVELPAELPGGDYSLRAYSNWMRNAGPEFFYRRNLRIGNSILTDILAAVEYVPQEGSGTVRIRFSDASDHPHAGIKVRYRLVDAQAGTSEVSKGVATTDAAGMLSIGNVAPAPRDRFVRVTFEDDRYEYDQALCLPAVASDYHVSFFPEGGDLLAGVPQTVAFKAQGSDGLSLSVEGAVTTAVGDTVAVMRTEHDGMGAFVFTPSAGERYRAETVSSSGQVRQFALPEVKTRGFGLSVACRNGMIFYGIQTASETVWTEPLYLLAHTRGNIRVLAPVSPTQAAGRIDANEFPEGIAHFLLVGRDGRALGERLVFIRSRQNDWSLATDRAQYGRREPVEVAVALKDPQGNPLCGRFSVSVTDRRTVMEDTLCGNILSDMLLTSDLKGYVEHPGYYFASADDPVRQRHLDLVMLTHGWRRFDPTDLNVPPVGAAEHYIEVGQTVSGQVKNGLGKGAKNASLLLWSDEGFMMKRADDRGRFLIDSIQFHEGTPLVVQANAHNGSSGVSLEIDPEVFPGPGGRLPFGFEAMPDLTRYLENTRDKYYHDGGMRVVHLKEFVVEGKSEPRRKSSYASMADQTVTIDKVPEFMRSRTVLEYVATMTGVRRTGNTVSIRENPEPPLVLIDDVPYNEEGIMERVYMTEVESVSIIKGGATSFFGIRGGGGVVCITRRRGSPPLGSASTPNVVVVHPLGFCEPSEFYTPVYDTPEKKNAPTPDLRTTIHWVPSLETDSTGAARIGFYTSDDPSSYRIEIEGVADDGTICRYSGDLFR
ncbi:TonB-dependent receptor [uncultured Alistipes sp.]|uniref:TonB-dependent receptor n=1 Tax=uncultured Alistipes sp. TaxID=538949 RepID=UPI0026357523|nr:TonB-dependent receptor plug domain-containing protein [uncultured Alistipes sp.]